MNTFKRMSWPVGVMMATLLSLLLSVSAYADTYNFYFKKKPGEGQEESAVSTSEEKKPEQNTLAVPKSSGSDQPIVIHNINNVGRDSAQKEEPKPVAPAPIQNERNYESHSNYKADYRRLDLRERERKTSPWRFGVGAALVFQDVQKSYLSSGLVQTYNDMEGQFGGIFSLALALSDNMNLNSFGGGQYSDFENQVQFMYGGELEILPFRIPLKRGVDLVQFGFLGGISNLMTSPEHQHTVHAGAKLNINFGHSFGITATGRANLGYVMFDAGIITRL